MPTLALVTDLIFSTRITATAQKLAAPCRVVRSPEVLAEALQTLDDPVLLLIDLNADGVDTVAVIEDAKRRHPSARVVAFLSHVQRELQAQAEASGADEVMPRSQFVQRLPELLEAAK